MLIKAVHRSTERGAKSMFGNKFMGTLRTTFIIDEKGVIEEVIRKVKTKDHTAQIWKTSVI